MRRLPVVAACVLALGHPAVAAEAVLRGLDKVTAKSSAIVAPIDQPVHFGTLSILVRTCRKAPPEERPEVSVFLQIDKLPANGEGAAQRIFSGWMFASSPELNPLEDPVYDVTVLDCR